MFAVAGCLDYDGLSLDAARPAVDQSALADSAGSTDAGFDALDGSQGLGCPPNDYSKAGFTCVGWSAVQAPSGTTNIPLPAGHGPGDVFVVMVRGGAPVTFTPSAFDTVETANGDTVGASTTSVSALFVGCASACDVLLVDYRGPSAATRVLNGVVSQGNSVTGPAGGSTPSALVLLVATPAAATGYSLGAVSPLRMVESFRGIAALDLELSANMPPLAIPAGMLGNSAAYPLDYGLVRLSP